MDGRQPKNVVKHFVNEKATFYTEKGVAFKTGTWLRPMLVQCTYVIKVKCVKMNCITRLVKMSQDAKMTLLANVLMLLFLTH